MTKRKPSKRNNEANLRLLVVGLNYAPDLVGIAKYTSEMAAWLASKGHDVEVVTAPPYYPSWRVDPLYRSKFYRKETHHHVKITRCPTYVPSRPTSFKRLLHLLSFAVTSFPCALWRAAIQKPDIVVSIAPSLFSSVAALAAARLFGGKSWLHIQDFEVDAAFGLGMIRGSWLRLVAARLELCVLSSFDKLSTISPQMRTHLLNKGCNSDRIFEFRNWVDANQIVPWTGGNSVRSSLQISSRETLLLYSGSIGQKQGLELVIEAARVLVSNPRVKFLICGDGPGKEGLQRLAEGLENVRFISLQPIERLNEVLGAADIHLLPQLAEASDLVLPSKLTGMLASGRPIIATAEPESGVEREVAGCGLVVPPADLGAFVRAVELLCQDPALRDGLGKAARNRAESLWSKESVLSALEMQLLASSAS
ncbi:WcaI family glycosyltransferase [Pyruvatibacter sp.]